MSMDEAHVYISGGVQGVGFRQFAYQHARELGLSGWVKNLSDGRIEIQVQGGKHTIETFLKACEKGPALARIKNIDVTWGHAMPKSLSFEILL